MFLSYLMLAVALCLSAIAAFYSIVGLTAIFAAAVIPIIVMGTILEIAKVTVTIWLHEYWQQCRLLMKIYLVPAVFTLMVITSMGIFGFLSKAHLDQVVPTGDVQAQVALIDEKINNERNTIANARTLLDQLDRAVSDLASAGDREIRLRDGTTRTQTAAERSLQVRRQQAKDRQQLTKSIEEAQTRIIQLQELKAPYAKDLRKIEAEVGPVKYIAALIYGDNPDDNLLEKAVRWVIIILVAVFDPLAIMMLLAATESLKWHRQKSIDDIEPQETTDGNHTNRADSRSQPDHADRTYSTTIKDQPALSDTPDAQQPDPGDPVSVRSQRSADLEPGKDHRSPGLTDAADETVPVTGNTDTAQDGIDIPTLENEETWSQRVIDEQDSEKTAMREWKKTHPESTIKEQRRLAESGVIPQVPWQVTAAMADNQGRASEVRGFGIEFPRQATKGDQFLRVDMMPSRLYKYNGQKWIEVEKHLSDQYAYDHAYIDYLISKIASGEYDADLLSEAEQQQIRTRLAQTRAEGSE